MAETRNAYKILVEKSETGGMILLKFIIKKQGLGV